jgi:hypothetical protein
MENVMKIAIAMLVSLMAFTTGEAAHCNLLENGNRHYQYYMWPHSQIHLDTQFNEHVRGKATLSNLGQTYKTEHTFDINDWTNANYTKRPSLALDDFHVETKNESLSGGVGIKTFPERSGLVYALQDIEYQFFPVDARDPLNIRWIGVPGVWSKVNFSRDTHLQMVWYETHWSKISPDTVPELKHIKFADPKGDRGYSLFTSFGRRVDDLSFEVGFTRGWGSWPSEERDKVSDFSPNPYQFSAAFFKIREDYKTWGYSGTALVKHSEENAGSIWNVVAAVDKRLSMHQKTMNLGTSIFIVDSFVQSEHIRTSPWEDLGNSISFWAHVHDTQKKSRYGAENVLNPEEYGLYVTGFFEKWVSDIFKLKTQMDFVFDRQKHVSEQHDSVRISAFGTITF